MDSEAITLECRDGLRLGGHLWRPKGAPAGTVIVNPATGVLARYYHRYARFLAGEGFLALTYDYRGIGRSRPERLRGCGFRWRHWGELDFESAVAWARANDPSGLLAVVGHSIGGFLPGFAANASAVDRMLTVGAQYAYWRDYAPRSRAGLWVKWHLAMPLATLACGYFPGRRLGWLEDLPAGIAQEWSFRRSRMELSYPPAERPDILFRFAAVRAQILAVAVADDPLATPRAIERALAYYGSSDRRIAMIHPSDLGFERIGHFDLFHDRHRDGFWRQTIGWLMDGVSPWPRRT